MPTTSTAVPTRRPTGATTPTWPTASPPCTIRRPVPRRCSPRPSWCAPGSTSGRGCFPPARSCMAPMAPSRQWSIPRRRRSHLRRMQANGAFSVKSYNQPRRDQRQQINQAARELGMLVVMEGGSTFYHNLNMIVDGATGVEHNLPVAPLYNDVIRLWAATNVGNTPTLVVSYGGVSGEFWAYQHDEIWRKEKLLRFFPREQLDARSIRRQAMPDEVLPPARGALAQAPARCRRPIRWAVMADAGPVAALGDVAAQPRRFQQPRDPADRHPQRRPLPGPGATWARWSRASAPTWCCCADPLADIRNSEEIDYVMVNGRLFDGRPWPKSAGGSVRRRSSTGKSTAPPPLPRPAWACPDRRPNACVPNRMATRR